MFHKPAIFFYSSSYSRSNIAPVLLLAVFSLFLASLSACGSSVKISREASTKTKPDWITKQPLSANSFYFVGIKTGADSLEEAQDSALKNAMAKISNQLVSKIESQFDEYTTEIEHELRQQISTKSSATVQGATLEDLYYEKISRQEADFRIDSFDAYVLVSLDKAKAQQEVKRQNLEKQQKVNTAQKFYNKGIEREQHNRYYEARKFYIQGLEAIADIEEILKVNDQNIENSQELEYQLKAHIQMVREKLFQVKVAVNVGGSSEASQAFLANFISSLGKGGFTVSEQEPALEITGKVFVEKSSILHNNYSSYNYVYYAKGSLAAIRVFDQQKIATYPFQTKGFHRLKEQAAFNALAEAGTEAGEEISKIIIERQNDNQGAILDKSR